MFQIRRGLQACRRFSGLQPPTSWIQPSSRASRSSQEQLEHRSGRPVFMSESRTQRKKTVRGRLSHHGAVKSEGGNSPQCRFLPRPSARLFSLHHSSHADFHPNCDTRKRVNGLYVCRHAGERDEARAAAEKLSARFAHSTHTLPAKCNYTHSHE